MISTNNHISVGAVYTSCYSLQNTTENCAGLCRRTFSKLIITYTEKMYLMYLYLATINLLFLLRLFSFSPPPVSKPMLNVSVQNLESRWWY